MWFAALGTYQVRWVPLESSQTPPLTLPAPVPLDLRLRLGCPPSPAPFLPLHGPPSAALAFPPTARPPLLPPPLPLSRRLSLQATSLIGAVLCVTGLRRAPRGFSTLPAGFWTGKPQPWTSWMWRPQSFRAARRGNAADK